MSVNHTSKVMIASSRGEEMASLWDCSSITKELHRLVSGLVHASIHVPVPI